MRIRLRFTKLGKIRFISHRDVARVWERALRRCGLPVATTQGFNPRPKVHFGLALSTGYESFGEYLDVDLVPDISEGDQIAERCSSASAAGELAELLSTLLPEGMDVTAVAVIERGTSLQAAVTSCCWTLEVPSLELSRARAVVDTALGADTLHLTRERKGKLITDDVRPMIQSLQIVGSLDANQQGSMLSVELATQARSVKPTELLSVLEPTTEAGHVWRTHQWIELDGVRHEPLDDPTRQHARQRAS